LLGGQSGFIRPEESLFLEGGTQMASMILNDAKEDENLSKIAKRLRMARKKVGITQDQLAGILGLNRAMIIDIEAGRVGVSNTDLVKMGKILRVSVERLISEIET
jgi:DNA-binding XRE family transcriptional regulator